MTTCILNSDVTQKRRRQSSPCCASHTGVRSIANKTRPQHARTVRLRRMGKGR